MRYAGRQMVQDDADGAYVCPSRCPGRAVRMPTNPRVRFPATFQTTRGATFALCGV